MKTLTLAAQSRGKNLVTENILSIIRERLLDKWHLYLTEPEYRPSFRVLIAYRRGRHLLIVACIVYLNVNYFLT